MTKIELTDEELIILKAIVEIITEDFHILYKNHKVALNSIITKLKGETK